jgi:hypothetical protein
MFRMVVRFKENGEDKKAGVHSIGRSQPTWTHTEVICNKALFIEKKIPKLFEQTFCMYARGPGRV